MVNNNLMERCKINLNFMLYSQMKILKNEYKIKIIFEVFVSLYVLIFMCIRVDVLGKINE